MQDLGIFIKLLDETRFFIKVSIHTQGKPITKLLLNEIVPLDTNKMIVNLSLDQFLSHFIVLHIVGNSQMIHNSVNLYC